MSFNFNWVTVSAGAPYVTVSLLGIAFNSTSISKLGNPEKVMIGFDEENCAIAVKPYRDEAGVKPHEFSSRVKNGWVRIGCRDFVKYLQTINGEDYSSAKRYIASYDKESGCWL